MKLPPPTKLRLNTMQQPFAGTQKQRYVYNETELNVALTEAVTVEPSFRITTLDAEEVDIKSLDIILVGDFSISSPIYLPLGTSGISIYALGRSVLTCDSSMDYLFDLGGHHITLENIHVVGGDVSLFHYNNSTDSGPESINVRRCTFPSLQVTSRYLFDASFWKCHCLGDFYTRSFNSDFTECRIGGDLTMVGIVGIDNFTNCRISGSASGFGSLHMNGGSVSGDISNFDILSGVTFGSNITFGYTNAIMQGCRSSSIGTPTIDMANKTGSIIDSCYLNGATPQNTTGCVVGDIS